MRHSLRLMALALTVATTALLAPVTHADPPPPQLPSQTPMLHFDQNGGANYYYWDSDGWGALNVKMVASGYASGVPLFNCKLSQNGNTFYGSGVMNGSYLFFTMNDYVFQGTPKNYGSYYPIGNPNKQSYFWIFPAPSVSREM
jgi:hypothetical protein